MANPEFLKERFPKLAGSPEVISAVKRTKVKTGKEVSRDPEARIQNYLDRFREIVDRKNPKDKTRGIKALKKILVGAYVARVEDIPESYWRAQMRVVRDRGQAGDWERLKEADQLAIKTEHLAQTKEDQKGSLEEWVDYMVLERSSYFPDYLKYWAFQGMLKLEQYEKGNIEKDIAGRFPERPTGKTRSLKRFPEVNERGLKFIADSMQNPSPDTIKFRYDIPPEKCTEFLGYLATKNFKSLYGWAQENIPPISKEEMQITNGEWVTYPQGSDPKKLTATLQGKGSGWCIAGENIARTSYLGVGNLFVYYTRDRDGNNTIPRVVIVEKGNRVTEVRGIEWEENIDRYIKETNIVADKLKALPGGKAFESTDKDTKQLTAIDRKITANQQLNGNELAFLYELDRPIKYFGIKKDPRIAELRKKRDPAEDMLVIFYCMPEQIAHAPREINEHTEAYVGKLEPGIFDTIQKYNIEHIYTSFPEGKIRKENVTIGGKTWQELDQEIQSKQMKSYGYALDMMKSKDFKTLETAEAGDYVRLKVRDLLPGNPTTDQIYAKAKELGLELCPAEVGPHYRLQYEDQPLDEYVYIAMKQIADRDGRPSVFRVGRLAVGLWLGDGWAEPDREWYPDDELLFRLRKLKT